MKNLTILLLLMLCSSLFSQNSKVYVYVNIDSARIKLDNTFKGIAYKVLPFIIETKDGKHEIIAEGEGSNVTMNLFKIKKGDSIQVFCLLPANLELKDFKPVLINSSESEPVFLVTEEPATFDGGDLSKFYQWVANNIKYPESLYQKGFSGKIYVEFVVNTKGDVEGAKVLRGIHPLLEEEAVRVIMSSPKWKPAKQGGRDVKQMFTLPVLFNIWETN